jgi:hypothetical protein
VSPTLFDQMLDNRETEAKAAMRPRRRAVSLLKPIEHPRQQVWCDADAGVMDHNLRAAVDALDTDIDHPLFGRELQRVRQEIRDHLLQALGIRLHEQRRCNGGAQRRAAASGLI